MLHRAAASCFTITLLALGAISSPSEAQTVVGRVVAAETAAPLGGVFISLTDSTGTRAAGFLSREDGSFAIRAPRAGTYLLGLEMIGYRGTSETLRLAAGETVRRTLRLPLEAIELDEIVATGTRQRECAVRPSEGDALARFWDAARQALRLAEWSEESGWLRASGHTYQRVLNLVDLEVLAQTVQRVRSAEPNAFAAPDPAVVHEEGFVRTTGDGGTLYYGADAALLLSDEFLDTHCFRLHERSDDGLVGLAFQPVSGRNVPEIEGVLWLEAGTARLHSLEYDYTRYAVPAPLPASRFGGYTEFRHLPGGATGVQRWRIRMPALLDRADLAAMQSVRRCGGDACDDGESLRHLSRAGLAIEEEGGAVLSYRFADGTTLPAADQAAITGLVLDSTAAPTPTPLSGAQVFIVGSEHRAVSDDRGRFRIDNLAEGSYRLAFRHPRLLQLGIAQPAATVVEATPGAVASAELALPSRATLALGRCGALTEDGAPAPDARVVHGVVRDAITGAAIGGAHVSVRRPVGGGEIDDDDATVVAEHETDPAGRYLFCDVPDGLLRVTADYLGKGERSRDVESRPGVAAEADLELVLSTRGRLVGRVTRLGDGGPVAGAQVRLLESAREVVTNEAGRFVFDSVTPGALTVEAEHVAYRTSRGAVALSGGETVEVELRVDDQVFDLEPIVVTARSRPLLMQPRMRGFYIRQARGLGTFIGPEEFERRPGARVTDFLREAGGIRVIRSPTGTALQGRRPPSLDPRNNRNPSCIPMVYLDGTLITTPIALTDATSGAEIARLIDQFPASDLAGIEVYAGAASVPGEFAGLDTDCGVVAVWTGTSDHSRRPCPGCR